MDVSALAAVITILFLAMFLLVLAIFIFYFLRWCRAAPVYRIPSVRVEDYSCPKCGSKSLNFWGGGRCRKCGTTSTINPEVYGELWFIWPFFLWFPIVWPIPCDRGVKGKQL